ncbi:NAD(P)/FAD-dependent oxidoreductase [Streptomyces sp. Li-HN-5-11]|uniref:flavin-containing monooxygenase n=1 Tax=Streptomyces sp. Li-HN-5-11 TaxID=3075432 RepID=UPI0028A62D36|nr:NAD(P)/FAD-dependent oxidoreductase [Streptomyces sp. Li-HN-5-11]WNM31728.1 NAD(P)/FAD-dependent oxidoreductase [Streptomyces sp. Li-HN-5-11]
MAHHDVVVIGAGFSGLYAAHKMRDQLGLTVQGFESAGGVGGTWWWNRYPGARCDIESVHYSYTFSEELQREWHWSERFASQAEILAYLEWVADKLDVRRAFRFNTRVTSLTWDDAACHWLVRTDDGADCTASFVVSCVGGLSAPKQPEFTGMDTFEGELYWTSRWPHQDVDFTGKRVAVIGTGSSGIQVIPEIAKQAAHLTVFQRTPNYAVPLNNSPVAAEQRRWNAEHHAELRAGSRRNSIGLPLENPKGPALDATPEERRTTYDKYYDGNSLGLLASTYTDLLVNAEANETLAAYVRQRIRERVKDAATAELLCPTDFPFATKRTPLETNYFETFNLPHVELVDVRPAPIEALTPTGVRTSEAAYSFDAIVLATGFDSFTGPMTNIDITGRDGATLKEKWSAHPATYLGFALAGFPNLFTVIGPQSAVGLYNTPLLIEDHVDLAAAAISTVRSEHARSLEPTPEAERAWVRLVEGIMDMTLFPRAKTSWYMGANIPGKPRGAYMFLGGGPLYLAVCREVEQGGFAGFALDGAARPVPSLLSLDAAEALNLAGMLNFGMVSLEDKTVSDIEALVGELRSTR